MWRVLAGLHNEVVLSFMMVGHTKFAPDWCFGLLRQRLRKTKTSCLADLKSAKANLVQLAGDQAGNPIVPIYDWAGYLGSSFHRVPNIKGFHHFKIMKDKPGSVFVKKWANGEEKEIKLLKSTSAGVQSLPPIIPPPGLPLARQQYLFEKIRLYCEESVKDAVCPEPIP